MSRRYLVEKGQGYQLQGARESGNDGVTTEIAKYTEKALFFDDIFSQLKAKFFCASSRHCDFRAASALNLNTHVKGKHPCES